MMAGSPRQRPKRDFGRHGSRFQGSSLVQRMDSHELLTLARAPEHRVLCSAGKDLEAPGPGCPGEEGRDGR